VDRALRRAAEESSGAGCAAAAAGAGGRLHNLRDDGGRQGWILGHVGGKGLEEGRELLLRRAWAAAAGRGVVECCQKVPSATAALKTRLRLQGGFQAALETGGGAEGARPLRACCACERGVGGGWIRGGAAHERAKLGCRLLRQRFCESG